jgi:hypothetical protein
MATENVIVRGAVLFRKSGICKETQRKSLIVSFSPKRSFDLHETIEIECPLSAGRCQYPPITLSRVGATQRFLTADEYLRFPVLDQVLSYTLASRSGPHVFKSPTPSGSNT